MGSRRPDVAFRLVLEGPVLLTEGSHSCAMAKSKNHTNCNQNKKAHRNGIKKTRRPKQMSFKGVDAKFLRNQRFAKRGMEVTGEEKDAREKMQREAQKRMTEKQEAEKAKRLKELEESKQAAMLKEA